MYLDNVPYSEREFIVISGGVVVEDPRGRVQSRFWRHARFRPDLRRRARFDGDFLLKVLRQIGRLVDECVVQLRQLLVQLGADRVAPMWLGRRVVTPTRTPTAPARF